MLPKVIQGADAHLPSFSNLDSLYDSKGRVFSYFFHLQFSTLDSLYGSKGIISTIFHLIVFSTLDSLYGSKGAVGTSARYFSFSTLDSLYGSKGSNLPFPFLWSLFLQAPDIYSANALNHPLV